MYNTAFEQLQRDVQYLKDRQEIQDCIHRHARGHDRFDVDLLTAAYHADGVDEHGASINTGPDYADWANAVHAGGSELCLHNITTQNCDIDGDVAHAESYVLVGLLNPDGASVRIINGRYVDRLERARWRLANCTAPLHDRSAVIRRRLDLETAAVQSRWLHQGYTRPE